MSGEIESREIVLVHAVDVRTVQRHLELRQQITILVVLAEQTLHARVDEDLAIIQFAVSDDNSVEMPSITDQSKSGRVNEVPKLLSNIYM